MSELRTVKEMIRLARSEGIVVKKKVKTIKLIDFEGEKVYIGPIEKPALLRTAEDIRKFSLLNKIKIKHDQQRRAVMIKRLIEHQLVEVIDDKVYAVAATAELPGELKSVPEIKSYARSRGFPITN